MLSFLCLHSLETRRLMAGLIIFGLVEVNMADYFLLQSTKGDLTTTCDNPYKLFVNYTKKLFSEHIVKVTSL